MAAGFLTPFVPQTQLSFTILKVIFVPLGAVKTTGEAKRASSRVEDLVAAPPFGQEAVVAPPTTPPVRARPTVLAEPGATPARLWHHTRVGRVPTSRLPAPFPSGRPLRPRQLPGRTSVRAAPPTTSRTVNGSIVSEAARPLGRG